MLLGPDRMSDRPNGGCGAAAREAVTVPETCLLAAETWRRVRWLLRLLFMQIRLWSSTIAALALCGACGDDGGAGPSGGASTDGMTGSATAMTGEPTDTTGQSTEGTGPGDSTATDTSSDGESTGAEACRHEPRLGIGGEAVPLADLEFRNAFDPTDEQIHDPENPTAVPGPLMVDVWGDRSRGPHGTLGVFPPGFVAPLHTHTHGYDGVVLRGEMSNPFGTDLEPLLDEDPSNDHGTTTLAAGSYWHVPGGAQHTTTCLGPEVCWFYFHAESLFDFAPLVDENGELGEGVRLEAPHDEAVLLPNAELAFAGEPGSFVQFAPAWGSMPDDAHGTFGLFEDGAVSPVHVHGEDYYGVVVSGTVTNPFDFADDPPSLTTGGYWRVPADSVHVTACEPGSDCLFYFHARGGFDFTPLCEQPG